MLAAVQRVAFGRSSFVCARVPIACEACESILSLYSGSLELTAYGGGPYASAASVESVSPVKPSSSRAAKLSAWAPAELGIESDGFV